MADFYNPEAPVTSGIHNLPHWQQGEAWVFVTWRLADSLPLSKIRQWKSKKEIFFKINPEPWDDETHIAYRKQFTDEIESWLDQGIGECFLKNHTVREIVSSALHHFDGERYKIDSYVVMPNHVHLLFQILDPHKLSDIMRSVKSFSAKQANKALQREGAFWQREYYDRLIRSPKHFHWARRYIDSNPRNLPPGSSTLFLK
jgi:REP element-mobilizing transposase RayT